MLFLFRAAAVVGAVGGGGGGVSGLQWLLLGLSLLW